MLENYVPPYDATVVRRLKEQGAVLLGKLNCDEFAMGSSTERSAYFPTRNPWDLARVPGGSSGGSAAAVAAGQALGALGTDTGGSIRQPAALCGVTGLKPTYGRVSRFGLVAFASSLDQIGPFARTARDCAILLGAIAGADPNDSTSAPQPPADYEAALTGDLRGLRVGVPSEYFIEGTQPGVDAAVREAIAALRDSGAEIVEISLPHTKYALPVYYIIAPAEASSNLARYDGVRYGLRVRRRKLLGRAGEDSWRRLRPRGAPADHARHLRAFGRLLRCLLQARPAGAHADPARFPAGLRACGYHRRANRADRGVQDRREDRRPAGDVPGGCVYAAGQSGRRAGAGGAMRLQRGTYRSDSS